MKLEKSSSEDSVNLGASQTKVEPIITPPPAHSNHQRQPVSSSPTDMSNIVGNRTPFGVAQAPQYVSNPYLSLPNHVSVPGGLNLNSLSPHAAATLNGKPSPSETEKVSNSCHKCFTLSTIPASLFKHFQVFYIFNIYNLALSY